MQTCICTGKGIGICVCMCICIVIVVYVSMYVHIYIYIYALSPGTRQRRSGHGRVACVDVFKFTTWLKLLQYVACLNLIK